MASTPILTYILNPVNSLTRKKRLLQNFMFHGRVLTCTAHIRRIQNPCSWQIKLLNGQFPIIRETTENGIPSYDVKKSETAKVIMYILVTVRRRFGFLMTTIINKRFPLKETKLIRNIKNDSKTCVAVVRLFKSWTKISIVVNVAFMIPAKATFVVSYSLY